VLDDKVVVIVGVGPGLGRSTASTVLAHGGRVVLGDLDGVQLAAIRAELDPDGARSAAVAGDLAEPATADALVAAAAAMGRLDALVVVAAVDNVFGGLMDGDLDAWDRLVDVNIKAALRLTRVAVPALRAAGGGSVVFIGSIGAVSPARRPMLAYGASKAAMVSVAHHLSRELGPDGIRVNTVAPGWKWGPVAERALQEDADRRGVTLDAVIAPITAQLSLRRFATDDDVANAVAFFCSDLARNVTGQTLYVDGGAYLH
jgi:NAD(P)-dependent dehydrogenase (short-subunit alcohol dehydrogenase family)